MAMHVTVKNGNVDMALRKIKQKMNKDGLSGEVKKREFYEKKGIRNRKAKKEAERKNRRNNKGN